MGTLAEKYAPQSWEEVVGQSGAVKLLRRMADKGELSGGKIWLSGKTGQGKTTLALLTARAFAGQGDTIKQINAADLSAEELAGIASDFKLLNRPLFGSIGKTVIIVNEAHSLKRRQIERLLTLLEETPAEALWIFTTTKAGQEQLFEDYADATPLVHRCTKIELAERGMATEGAPRLKAIAEREGLDGRPVEAYVKLLRREDIRGSMRGALNAIQAGEMLAN